MFASAAEVDMLEQRWFAGATIISLLCACNGGTNDTTGSAGEASTGAAASGSTTTAMTGETTDETPGTTTTPTPTTTSEDPTTGSVPTTSEDPTTAGMTSGTTGDETTGGPVTETVQVHLVPQPGASGPQRVNFAVPLAPGQLTDESLVQVKHAGVELAVGLRGLARHPDGSWRSVQVQVEVDITGETDLEVEIGTAATAGTIELLAVQDTLMGDDVGPRVWALLPNTWLARSGVVGPIGVEADAQGEQASWATKCDYAKYGVEAFLAKQDDENSWLGDRGTAHYRGYARRGDLVTLRSGYLETTLYRNGMTGSGPDTDIGVPNGESDLKFFHAQSLAIHYLLTGDERFRESTEDLADAAAVLWISPGYAGKKDFWTERNAGAALLAYVWAMMVTDDQAQQFADEAKKAVAAYLAIQDTYPEGYDDAEHRCFAHDSEAHGLGYSYFGCSPWMSALLAEALDQYAAEIGGAEAEAARQSIVKLGKIVARDGLDMTGKPFFWMGVGTDEDEPDQFDEHWGEVAYLVAMAWHHGGKTDATLKSSADALVSGFATKGKVPSLRSFNQQCRSAVATPWFLRP
jgi:hypothetical protein